MKRVLAYYKIYSFFSSLLFFIPVLLTIYINRGITTEKVLLIEACYNFTIFLFEVPTGYFGDKFGHDKSVYIGLIGTTISYVIFAFSMNLTFMIISQVLLAFFSTFISGSDLGSLATYMEKDDKIDTLKVQEDIYAINTIAKLFSFLVSGIILSINERGTVIFLLTAAIYFMSAIVYMLFVHSKKKYSVIKDKDTIEEKNQNKLGRIKLSILKEVLICGILLGILSTIYLVSQVYYSEVQIDSRFLGAIYCLSSVLTIICTRINFKFNSKLLLIIPCIFLITIFKYKIVVILFVSLNALINSKVYPFVNDYILMSVGKNKAFSMSISSLISNLINTLVMVSLSGIISKMGFEITMVIITFVTLIICSYIIIKSSFNIDLKRACK